MKEFTIRMQSVQDVQRFVALATSQPFPIWVGKETHLVSGKSFMELCCLDFSRPLQAFAECSGEEFLDFLRDARAFLAK